MGAQEKSPTAKHSMQRVKVYRLSGDGKWDDQGTGHVTVDYLEVPNIKTQRLEELGLFVIDEEDNETLLSHRISSDDIYRKQEDTIISGRDPEFSTELALSFQETTGCSYICDETYHSVNSELRELPAVELSTLPIILKMSSSNVNGGRGEGVMQMENMPTVTEQQLRLMNEQLRFQSEELQFLRAKVLGLETDINQNSCRIYGLFILLVIGISVSYKNVIVL
ncbi:unnamed protein product [Camellia sinensis]